ncbi:MAG TPA: PH domain-containing protein [Candidatus Krumholzibacteria bacterium]|nr:PH domain-containing protein [Candidatus Krumholzibacteria bacterium]
MTSKSHGPSAVAENLRSLITEEQDPAAVQAVCSRVQQILTSGETILYVAVQKKPVVNVSPECVVLTNRRFIVYRPSLLGRVTFEDQMWRDLHDATLRENIVGATFTLATVTGRVLTIEHLPKAQARRLYAFAQEMEERVREERRALDLEEKRAAAGGVVVSGIPATGSAAEPPSRDPVQRLKALKEMYDAGLISAGEYEAKRAEIVSRM